jgi:hypothetical protein
MNSGFGPATCAIGARGADALQSADESGQEVGGRPRRRAVRWPDAAGTSEVYSRDDLHLYPFQGARLCGRERADGPHAGRSAGMREQSRADRCRADKAALRAGQGVPADADEPGAIVPGTRALHEGRQGPGLPVSSSFRVVRATRTGSAVVDHILDVIVQDLVLVRQRVLGSQFCQVQDVREFQAVRVVVGEPLLVGGVRSLGFGLAPGSAEAAMIIAASSTATRTGADGPSAVVQWR